MNKCQLFIALFLLFSVSARAHVCSSACSNGIGISPVHEWKFDEGSGQTAADSVGSLDFGLGSNISASDSNDPDWICGAFGHALSFVRSNNDYATTQSTLTPPTNGTLVFWIKTTELPAFTRRLFSQNDDFEIRLEPDGTLIFDLNRNDGNGTFQSNTVFSDFTKLYHVAAVFSADDDDFSIYVDGVLDKSDSLDLSPGSARVIDIGRRDWAGTLPFYYDGALDEIAIYDQELTQSKIQQLMSCSAAAALDSFTISVDSSASVCMAESVTISARDADGDVIEEYVGTIDLSTSTSNGDWSISSALGSLTPGASDSGSASYEFEQAELDQGQVTLSLENVRAESLTITVDDAAESVSATSSTVTFSENVFVLSENDTLDYDVIAGRRHQFSASMMLREPGAADCSVATTYNESTIKAWVNRSAQDPGGAAPVINNALLNDSASLLNSEGASLPVDLNFSSGTASFSLDTSDVGQYSIELYDDTTNFSDQAIRGSSQSLNVRPFAFEVSVAGNPEANSATGTVFLSAGSSFDATVRAVGWHTNDDNDENGGAGDGQPDTYQEGVANPANDDDFSGATLLSFGQESTPETVTLSSSLYEPSGGTASALGSSGSVPIIASSFSSGVTTVNNLYYPEVGIIQIEAGVSDGTYLSSTATALSDSQSALVGRFIPSYFEVVVDSFADACGSFTYFDQSRDAEVDIVAKNTLGSTTQNYEGAFQKLDNSQGSLTIGAIDSVAPTALSSRVSSVETYSWVNGVADVTSTILLARNTAVEAPFTDVNFGVSLSDTDSVTLQNSALDLDVDNDMTNDMLTLGADEYRFGRLALPSNHGPESAELKAAFETEYWNGAGWIKNTDDACTAIADSDISFPDGTIDVLANRTVTVGAGTSTGGFTDLSLNAVRFTAGDAGLVFSAPGAGNTGTITVDVDLSSYAWLQFNWDQSLDGSSDTSLPTAEFTFGSYRGHDRIIFWQEILSN